MCCAGAGAHQTNAAAAIDKADVTFREFAAEFLCQLDIARQDIIGRAAINADGLDFRHAGFAFPACIPRERRVPYMRASNTPPVTISGRFAVQRNTQGLLICHFVTICGR